MFKSRVRDQIRGPPIATLLHNMLIGLDRNGFITGKWKFLLCAL